MRRATGFVLIAVLALAGCGPKQTAPAYVAATCAAHSACSARYPDLQLRFDALLSSWLTTTHAPAQRSPCAKRMVAAFYADPSANVDASCIAGDRPAFPYDLEP